jgi:phosphoribosyl 1,2-cyclic phosphodiesterase
MRILYFEINMSLFIASLNSGSNGNCYYIGNHEEAVFIDAGISCSETEKRMERLGLQMEKIKAIFISHEHSDHVSGISTLAKKYKLPVYITTMTYRHAGFHLPKNMVHPFETNKPIQIGGLMINAFQKSHDAIDPHSFTVTCKNITVGIFTDIGKPCEKVIDHFKKCHAAFLEANYDEDLLQKGRYPIFLKKRIDSDLGHLSNRQALELFIDHRPAFMSHLLLSHLSKENNSPSIVENLFKSNAGNTAIVLTSRDKETDLYPIEKNILPIRSLIQKKIKKILHRQLSLFEH